VSPKTVSPYELSGSCTPGSPTLSIFSFHSIVEKVVSGVDISFFSPIPLDHPSLQPQRWSRSRSDTWGRSRDSFPNNCSFLTCWSISKVLLLAFLAVPKRGFCEDDKWNPMTFCFPLVQVHSCFSLGSDPFVSSGQVRVPTSPHPL